MIADDLVQHALGPPSDAHASVVLLVACLNLANLLLASIGDSRDVAPAGAADARSPSVGAVFSVVGRDYARVLGLPMLGGRDFSNTGLAPGSGERVAIIDDALAEELWHSDG